MEVKIYLGTEDKSPRKKERQYGYVLECEWNGQTVTKEGFGRVNGTYNQAVLRALAEALGRITRRCEITICSENEFVLDMLVHNLKTWADHAFCLAGGKELKNKAEWEVIWERVKIHQVTVNTGCGSYLIWMREEMKRRKRDESNQM